MGSTYAQHKDRVLRALEQMGQPGWKPVVNLRTRLCTLFVGALHPETGYEGMIADRRQGHPFSFDAGQQALLQSIGWIRPESKLVRAYHKNWDPRDVDRVARDVLNTLAGVFEWEEDEPLWVHLTHKRKPRARFDVDGLLDALDKHTVVSITPHVELLQRRAWTACTEAFYERRCDVVLAVKHGRNSTLSRFGASQRLQTPPAARCSINYLMHPEAPSPDWLAHHGRPS